MAKAKKQSSMAAFVDGLHVDNIDSEVRTVDWSEIAGEDLDGYRCVEVAKCDTCGKWVSSEGQLGESRHRDLDQDSDCAGYFSFDGPMMNYFYPCAFRKVGGVDGAAHAIKDTCCVAVEFDGETGFALSGGGMDLSWEIAGAYVACGMLPPAWVRLPRMAGYTLTARRRRIIAACIESQHVSTQHARNNIRDLLNTRKALAEQTQANRKRKREQPQQPAV